MRSLPLPARLYLIALALLAAGSCAAALGEIERLAAAPAAALLVFGGLLLAYRAEVSFESRPGHNVTFTVDDAVAIFSVSTFGLAGAPMVAAALCLSQLLWRTAWERVVFNVSMIVATYSLASALFRLLHPAGAVPFGGPTGPLTFLSVAGAYYGCNALLVSLMIALASGRPVGQIYRESMLQVSWVHLLTYAVGAAMAALYAVDPWLLLYGVTTLVVARSAFATVAALNAETRRRQALAEERAALYEEQARLNEELGRASKLAALGTFSAGIAHEFNNVLGAIQGHAQLAQIAKSPVDRDNSLEVIVRVTHRATSITNSLLTFAREREPDLSLNFLRTAIEETVAMVRPDLEYDRIALSQEVAELPPILCDVGQLNQVLLNLITNSRDALRTKGAGGHIRLSLHQEGDEAVLAVADDGPGMSPELLDSIFQPFVTTKKTGNGLGMAICYGIVSGHKGTISVASELGQGTVVTIRLPMRTDEPPAVLPEDELLSAA